MYREDYIMRLVRQLAEAVARMAGLRKAGDHDGALAAAGTLYDELGIARELIDLVDTPTLASLLGRPDKMRAAAQLLWEEGHIYKAKRDPLAAFTRYKHAHQLFLEARAVDPQPDDDSAILELSRVVHARDLDPQYRNS